jgi:hypothetical protein
MQTRILGEITEEVITIIPEQIQRRSELHRLSGA